MTRKLLAADRFTATPHSTAEEKTRFCNDFIRFILSGFDRKRFTKKFYERLSNILGHIAHFNARGFWETWFSTPVQQRQFVQHIHECVPLGDPHFCWVDVERELKSWIVTNAEAVNTVLPANERKFAEAAKAECDRRAALVAKTCQQFTVVAKSSNIGSFGHRQYIMCAGWQCVESAANPPLSLGDRAGRERAAPERRSRLVRNPGRRMPRANSGLPAGHRSGGERAAATGVAAPGDQGVMKLDYMPPGRVQKIGDERFPRFIIRDALGQYFARPMEQQARRCRPVLRRTRRDRRTQPALPGRCQRHVHRDGLDRDARGTLGANRACRLLDAAPAVLHWRPGRERGSVVGDCS